MNVLERQAWFTMIVIIIVVFLYLAIVACIGFPAATIAVYCFGGLLALAGLIGRKERNAGKIFMDERDCEIAIKSERVAYYACLLIFWLGSITPFLIYGVDAKIAISTVDFPGLAYVAILMTFFVRSLAMVILYRKSANT